MIRRPPRSTQSRSSAASDVYKRQECNNLITTYSEAGSDMVEKIKYENGKVYINNTQYFGNVPEVAWSFYIGGYQPAQKWLKDRKGRTLLSSDIEHYQKLLWYLPKRIRL